MSLANYKSKCIEKYKNANPDKDIPANIGSKWTDTEEQTLLNNMKIDLGIEEIAKKHGRTSGAINIRLEVIAMRMYEENRYDIEYIEELTKLNERDIRNAIEKKQNYKKMYGAPATQVTQVMPIYNDSDVLVSGLRKDLSICFEEIKGLKETVRTLLERESRNDIEELKKQIQSMLDINTIKNDIIELKNAIGTYVPP